VIALVEEGESKYKIDSSVICPAATEELDLPTLVRLATVAGTPISVVFRRKQMFILLSPTAPLPPRLILAMSNILFDVDEGVIEASTPVVTNVVLVVEVVASVYSAETTCNTFPALNPVTVAPVKSAVPLMSRVAPDAMSISADAGSWKTSEASPRVVVVPVAGLILFALTSLLM
jgi:hypothetical protein